MAAQRNSGATDEYFRVGGARIRMALTLQVLVSGCDYVRILLIPRDQGCFLCLFVCFGGGLGSSLGKKLLESSELFACVRVRGCECLVSC